MRGLQRRLAHSYPEIECRDVARALMIEAELQAKTLYPEAAVTYKNDNLVHLVKTGTYPEHKEK